MTTSFIDRTVLRLVGIGHGDEILAGVASGVTSQVQMEVQIYRVIHRSKDN